MKEQRNSNVSPRSCGGSTCTAPGPPAQMNQCYSPQVIIAGRGYLFPLKSECKVTLIMWGDYQHSRWSLGHSSREVVYIAMQISCDADEDEVLIISEVCCGLLAAFCWRLHCWSHLAPQKRTQNVANFLRWGEYDTPCCCFSRKICLSILLIYKEEAKCCKVPVIEWRCSIAQEIFFLKYT